MKTFLVIENQGGGCDYTIGCGVLTYTIEAESMEAAVAQLKKAAFAPTEEDVEDEVGGGLLDTQERRRARASVYEVSASMQLPLDAWRTELRAASERRQQAAKEREERDTLAKLQKKYEAS